MELRRVFLFLSNPIIFLNQRFLFSSFKLFQNNHLNRSNKNIMAVKCLSTAIPRSGVGKVQWQRIERIISNRGVGSRKDVSSLFRRGVVKVDGKVIRGGAERFPIDVIVEVDGVESHGIPLLAVYHKPVDIHCTMRDPWGRDCLDKLHLTYPYLSKMHPVGRLDTDTSGLLLFSKNGDLTQTLLHPSSNTEREYEALVRGEVTSVESLRNLLQSGVNTTEGCFPATLLEVRPATEEERLSLEPAAPDNEPIRVSSVPGYSYVRLSVVEGKHRMVRRILHNCGHSVLSLHRPRYGNICLQPTDELGTVRPCSISEIEWAKLLLESRPKK